MEDDDSGLELSLGLSLGGSKRSSDLGRNPSPNPKPDEASSTHNFRNKHNGVEGGTNTILIDLTKSSPLSINTGDGSVGENDDVAESRETEGSNYNSGNKGSGSASGATVNRFSGSGSVPVSFQSANHVMMPSGSGRVMPGQQVAFGYSSVQFPTLETNPVWAYNTRVGTNDLNEQTETKVQGSMNPRPSHSSSPQLQENLRPTLNPNLAPNPNPDPNPNQNPPPNPNPNSIRAGLSPNVRFGGSGSRPDLPWVTTTGSGPTGKTISGVPYRHGPEQIRIVCACHGFHMSPQDFAEHASQVT